MSRRSPRHLAGGVSGEKAKALEYRGRFPGGRILMMDLTACRGNRPYFRGVLNNRVTMKSL